MPNPEGGAPVSPSPMTQEDAENARVDETAGRVSLVKDWRSILALVGSKELRRCRKKGCVCVNGMISR